MSQTVHNPYKNRKLILFNVVLMTYMATLDNSIVNVALPKMAEQLSVTTSVITWIVTVYLIVICASVLTFGRLGDIIGMTRVFKIGIVLFTLGSLMCGLSTSLPLLIISRIIQGIGAAGTMATNFGIITQVFPSNVRGRALGISSSFVALGTMTGPSLGGFIVDLSSWHYIFLINVPIGIFALLLGMKVLPKATPSKSKKLDLPGAVLFCLAIVFFFIPFNVGDSVGYGYPLILLSFAVSLITLLLFILLEKKLSNPLLNLSIFKNSLFSLSIFCGFISFIAIGSYIIIQPFYLQNAMKLSSSATGMLMIVYPLILAVVAPYSGYLSDKIGSEILTFLGLTLGSISLFLMSGLKETSSLYFFIVFVIIMAIGNGLFQSPNNSLIMSNVSQNHLSIAGSMNSLVKNLGMVVGMSFSTTLLYSRMSDKLGHRTTNYVTGREDVFIYGMKGVYIAAAVICTFGAVLTAYRLYRKKRGTG